jgi:uncharacterized membrane protein YdbT with pleckstrin-like domain
MTYIDRILDQDENVIHRGKLHWVIYVAPTLFILLGLAFIAVSPFSIMGVVGMTWFLAFGSMLLLVGAMGWIIAWIKQITTEIAVTSRRVIVKYGLIWRSTMELNAGKIESVQVDQTVMGRILDFGIITARGTGSGIEPVRKVAAPLELRAAIGQLQSRVKGRRRRSPPDAAADERSALMILLKKEATNEKASDFCRRPRHSGVVCVSPADHYPR